MIRIAFSRADFRTGNLSTIGYGIGMIEAHEVHLREAHVVRELKAQERYRPSGPNLPRRIA